MFSEKKTSHIPNPTYRESLTFSPLEQTTLECFNAVHLNVTSSQPHYFPAEHGPQAISCLLSHPFYVRLYLSHITHLCFQISSPFCFVSLNFLQNTVGILLHLPELFHLSSATGNSQQMTFHKASFPRASLAHSIV